MSTDTRLHGVMIGAGQFATYHIDAWSRLPDVRITAVCDRDPNNADDLAQRYGVSARFTDWREMIDSQRPDFVDIITPPETHHAMCLYAAQHGAHVICQQPLAPTAEAAAHVVSDMADMTVRFMVHENWRWQPWYREAKRALDAGDLGRVVQATFVWRTGDGRGPTPYPTQPYFSQMPRLLVYETLVHLLDTFRYLVGEVEHLSCETARVNPAIAGEDQALIHLKFAGGGLGLIDGNRVTGPDPPGVAMGTLLLEGERGTLRVSPDGYLWLTRAGEAERRLPFDPPTAGYKGDSVFATQAHLIECLRTGRPSESDGRDYLKTVALVEACYRSAATGARAWPEF
jgi:D-apiose dehydrogenase